MSEFNQLCVWPGVTLDGSTPEEFESFMNDEFGVKIKFDCEVKTLQDTDENGQPIPDTGGRNDLLFYVAEEHIGEFAVPRLKAGIRWWEDVVKYNDNAHLYSKEFREARPCKW